MRIELCQLMCVLNSLWFNNPLLLNLVIFNIAYLLIDPGDHDGIRPGAGCWWRQQLCSFGECHEASEELSDYEDERCSQHAQEPDDVLQEDRAATLAELLPVHVEECL